MNTAPIHEYDASEDEYHDTGCKTTVTQTETGTIVSLEEPDVEKDDQPIIHIERRPEGWRVLINHGTTGEEVELFMSSDNPGSIDVNDERN